MLIINITREDARANDYTIRLRSDGRDGFTSAIESLKSYVDASCRSYDPQTKKWHVDEVASAYMHDWLDYCRAHLGAEVEWFGTRRTEKKRTEQPPPPKKVTLVPHVECYRALYLVPGCPPELVKAAYRCLAQIHHPDKGGSSEAMQKINEAYRRLAA
jgi:hypothetical protein